MCTPFTVSPHRGAQAVPTPVKEEKGRKGREKDDDEKKDKRKEKTSADPVAL